MTLMDKIQRGVDALAASPLLRDRVMRDARQTFIENRTQNLFFGVHSTWQEAEAAAASFGSVGYDHESTVDMYAQRTRKDQHDYPAAYWILRSLQEGHRSVFDVGGNIGIKYMAFRDILMPHPDLRWRVQDVSAIVRHGRELALARGDTQLEFTDRFEDGDGIDLLYASGVLQYLPKTLGELLGGYRRLPKRILINTAAIHPAHEFFTVNNIWAAFCPYRVQTQASLIGGLTALGYRLRETWTNPDKPLFVPGRPDCSLRHYSGYCLDLAADKRPAAS